MLDRGCTRVERGRWGSNRARFWSSHSSTRRAACSKRYMRISGPITTVHKEHIYCELPAAAKIRLTSRRWLSDRNRSFAVVLGNHPISVALTVIPRLWWVLRITARQSNSMLEPTNACEPNVVRLELRSAQQSVRCMQYNPRSMISEDASCFWR